MRVVREHDVARFLERAGPRLRERSGENNLMLGLLGDLVRAGVAVGREAEHNVPPLLLLVEGAQGVEAVALQTPPRAIILSRASDQATNAIVAFAISSNFALSGVIGPEETAERFASRWAAQTGSAVVLRLVEVVYELARVRPAAPCAGKLREATTLDENLLAQWLEAFTHETGIDPIHDDLAFARAKIAARQLFVWDNGAPVSMAAWGGRTAQGVRITYVYTPHVHRRKGYASALVGALSQQLLDEGCPRCFLFTNAANPTSNKIYQALGYERVSDFRLYDFRAP